LIAPCCHRAFIFFKEVATISERSRVVVTESIKVAATVKNLRFGFKITEAIVVVVRFATGHVVGVAVASIQSELERKWYQIASAHIEGAAMI
jgi:hypothetical protein